MLVSRFAARALARHTTTAALLPCRVAPSSAAFAANHNSISSPSQWFSSTSQKDDSAKKDTATAATTTSSVDVHPNDASTVISKRQRIVIAVGGNALQRRGERLTIENM